MALLPTEQTADATWPRVAAVLGCSALVVVGLNIAAKVHLDDHSPNWSHRMVEAKFALTDQPGPQVDWLVLGDSSAAHGVMPAVWTAQTGATVRNLATVAGLGVVGDAWALQDHVRRQGPPQGVVLMHTLDAWDRSAEPALVGQIPRSAAERARWRPQLSWGARDHLDHALSRYLPLYAESGSLISSLFGTRLAHELEFVMDPHGWVRSRPPDPTHRAKDAEQFLTELGTGVLALPDGTSRALHELGAQCAELGLPVVVVHAPLAAEVAGHPVVLQRAAEVERRVPEALAPAEVVVLPGVQSVEDDALEATVDHLVPDAARRFTQHLAQKVAASVPAVRPGAAAADPADATHP